jgi:tetratricopeptide (TPR) repeat protein
MKDMKRFFVIIISVFLLMNCAKEDERKIKLAAQPVTALKQKQVATIELAAAQKKKVAIIRIQNQSEAGNDWLERGISKKLHKQLEQSPQLNLNPTGFVSDAFKALQITAQDLTSESISAQVAQKIDADVLILGSFSFDLDALQFDVELRQSDGTVLNQFTRTSPAADTLTALNTVISQMAVDIRRALEDRPKGIPEVETAYASASSTSIEALKLYVDALEKLDQFYMEDAIPLFQKAVQLDTTFASAYSGLAQALMRVGQYEDAQPVLEKALRFSEHLPDRERVPIEAHYAMMNGEYVKAIELYNQLLALYPEDYDIHYEVGQYYFGVAQNFQKAIEKFETVLELYPKHKMAHNHLAYAYAHVGELERAFYILDKYAELAPDEPNPFDSYGELLMSEGRLEDAIKMFEKALDVKPDFWHSKIHMASAYRDLGKFRKARKLLTQIEADTLYEKVRAMTTHHLALNAIAAGNLDLAEDYFQKAVQDEPENLSYNLALLYIKPEKEEYQKWFVDEIERQVVLAEKDSLKYGFLLGLVSQSLSFNLAVDRIDLLLDSALKSTTDPILYQVAVAYKLILDLRQGRSTAETEKLYARTVDPATFQYARPATWNDYWRHYFDALHIGAKNGVPVGAWADGFYQFAKASGNEHFTINSAIAVAATEFYSGHSTAAMEKMHEIGIPCEDDWKFVGPFEVKKGFHQQFWPEKVEVEKWPTREKYKAAIFQKRDDLFDGYVNLKELVNFSTNQAVYALLEINAKDYKQAQLRFGMGGRLKVWLNGERVMMKNSRGDAVIDRYIANVKLHLGTNYVLVRVDNAIGELGFYFRVTDMQGNGDDDIEFNAPMMANIIEEDDNLN